MTDWLPELIRVEDHGGDWAAYLRVVHDCYRRDFVERPLPEFRGLRMNLKRHPVVRGWDATFWHFISEGDGGGEDDRMPDPRRCERIRWPRPILEAAESRRVCAWSNERKGEERVLLAVDDFSYVVVVAVRKDYALPWTAYPVGPEHRRRKLREEYERFHANRARKS